MDNLPFSQACENNKAYILEVLKEVFAGNKIILEIASGTGQHACHFAEHMPWIKWQPTEVPEHLSVLQPRCSAYTGENVLPVQALDVLDKPWPLAIPDGMFTANSFHIMPWVAVEAFFASLAAASTAPLTLAVYGPFNYQGSYTSASNARFDEWLHVQNPLSGIRHFEEVDALALAAGLDLDRDVGMPANNRLLVWGRS